jgi:hypothetical protein
MSHFLPAAGTPGRFLPLSGPGLLGPCHACAFFRDPEDEYRVLLPFATDCAHCGERCLQYVDPSRRQERRARLMQAGIEVSDAPAGGPTEVRTWDDAYLRGGRFDQDDMLALVEETMNAGRPFGRTRAWANMEWALKGSPGSEDLIEYESRLNTVVDKHTDVVVCAYRHGKYSASVVMDILRAHPMIVIGDMVQQNPLYVPTDQFMEDLRQRRSARPGLRSEAGGSGQA